MRKLTTEEFIDRSKQVHGDKYSYDLVQYINSKVKVKIICSDHGVFEQIPNAHISQKQGCPKCKGGVSITLDEFKTRSSKKHNGIYNYDMVKYIDANTKVKIICTIHGIFEQAPGNHLFGQRCPKCFGKIQLTNNTFISKAKQAHGDRYDYSLVEYTNIDTKVKIICPIHGPYRQRPNDHLMGRGCPACAKIISRQEIEFVEYIRSLYNDKIITNTRSVIPPYELDVYLPDKQIAFEYNGKYWHNEGVTKPIGYHQMKTDMCMDKGVELHHIWEQDWIGNNINTKDLIIKTIL